MYQVVTADRSHNGRASCGDQRDFEFLRAFYYHHHVAIGEAFNREEATKRSNTNQRVILNGMRNAGGY
jgi:hypothetical protein